MGIYLVATNYWIVLRPRTEMGTRVMTTNNIDRELGQSNELRDNDLECVVGGLTVTKEVDASSPNFTVGTGPELTEDELNHVSGGKPSAAPKQDAFPTETIKLNYGSTEWKYT